MAETELSENSACPAEVKVQLMPFDMDYDGKANIKDYFETTIRGDLDQEKTQTDMKNSHLNASFRGRLLNGRNIELPEDYQVCSKWFIIRSLYVMLEIGCPELVLYGLSPS